MDTFHAVVQCQYHESCWVYLNCRKDYVKVTKCAETVKKDIKCGVLQGPIQWLFIFLLYVNDLPNSSNVLVPIKSADDPNLL